MKISKILALILLTATCASYGAAKPAAKIPAAAAKIEMIKIPAGKFLMGASKSKYDAVECESDEKPQHWVYLSAYSIGKYEVTRGQYASFMNDGGYTNKRLWSSAGWRWKVKIGRKEPEAWAASQNWDGEFIQTDNHPVIGVSFYEAEAFCNWAGGHLPTEAQWEKAARWNAARKHPNVYPWGDEWDAEKCNNYDDNNSNGGGDARFQTAPVGSYPNGASPYGCQDMAGNAWEWCKDWYSEKYYSKSRLRNPQGPSTGESHVIRGGGTDWEGATHTRCAFRYNDLHPVLYFNYYGFRLAR